MSEELVPVGTPTASLGPGDGPIAFHGINKSGSLAVGDVLRDAFYAARRADAFFSVYHGVPKHHDDLIAIIRHSAGPNFYLAHNLHRAVQLASGGRWVTQVRHPVQRTLSIFGWLRRNHLNRHGTLDGLPTLTRWVRGLRGRAHTQMEQLAHGFPDGKARRGGDMPLADMRDLAFASLQEDFAWFGVADHLEASIFVLAGLCGLPAVPLWKRDQRNVWRPASADVTALELEAIYETLAEEITFYEQALELFTRRISSIDLGPSFPEYEQRCRGEYGDSNAAFVSPGPGSGSGSGRR